jgi:hypothetical protein
VPIPRSLSPALLAGAAVLAATAALTPASAASKPAAVKGGITQAYQATYYVKPVAPVIPATRYYFGGTSSDDANKLSGAPTATLSTTKPTAASDITQSSNVLLAGGTSNDKGSAFWTGAYTGSINGTLQIHWFWATHDAAAGNNNVIVHVFADPGTPKEKQIGSTFAGVTVANGSVVEYTASVDVLGSVGKSLQISAEPRYIDASNDLVVHYGSTTALSYVDIPKGPPHLVKIPTTQTVKDTNPLVVSSTYIGRKAAEPTLGVTPKGNAFIAAADFDGISPATPRTLIYSSADGNKSWHNVSPLIAGQPTPPTTADPYLYVDPVTGRIFNDDLTAACSFLQWSDDEGKTFQTGNPLACESPVDDHQTVVTGVPVAGLTTTGYPRIVYYCVNKVADVSCARSLDGGKTFTFTGAPAYMGVEQPRDGDPGAGSPVVVCGGLHGHIITDPGGRLYVPKGHCNQPWVSISPDGGASWTQVRVNPMLLASIQTSIASDTSGNLYYTWFGEADKLPYMAVSKDHGVTWGPALLIAPPGVTAVNYPSIDVQAPGHLVMSFPGTTGKTATAARPWNYYVAVTTDALSKLPTFHSTTANNVADPIHRGPCLSRCAGMYDFIDVVIAPNSKELWAAGVDTCTSSGCKSATGTTLTAAEAAKDAQGFVVRQLSGPGLTTVVTPVSKPVVTPVTKPVTSSGGGGLPATGLGLTLPVVGLLAFGLALLLRRRTA